MPAAWNALLDPQKLKTRVASLEEWWFDKTRSIHTSGNVNSPRQKHVTGEVKDSYMYVPVRVTNARTAIRDLPIADPSRYTFIDMGSGKGRSLFVAAEFPFRRVIGVEFVEDLHREASENIRSFRSPRRRSPKIESIHANAMDFAFPNDNIVLYLFNPFGPEIMARVRDNLMRSLAEHPRHATVLLLWPENSDLFANTPGLSLYTKTRRHHIYQNSTPPTA
jgi:hypothetical protein